MIINKEKIKPGEHKLVKIRVSKLPSGTPIDIHANVFRSKNSGPTILVLGGMHGDEVNGVEIVRRMVGKGLFNEIKLGTIIAVPLLNVYGFINFSREVPDGKDINRSFPGTPKGSLASRVANKVTKEILPHVDLVVDFHTGGNQIYNVPQIRITQGNEPDFELAKIFGTKFIVNSAVISRSLRKELKKRKKPVLVFEGGESLRFDEDAINQGINGVKNLLIHYQMLDGEIKSQEQFIIKEGYWERAPISGIFKSIVKPGDYVQKGSALGKITAPFGEESKTIKSKKDGYIYGLNHKPVVNQGDALFHVGQLG